MRWNILRLSLMASMMTDSPGLVRTIAAADLAASVAPETEIPASHFFKEDAISISTAGVS